MRKEWLIPQRVRGNTQPKEWQVLLQKLPLGIHPESQARPGDCEKPFASHTPLPKGTSPKEWKIGSLEVVTGEPGFAQAHPATIAQEIIPEILDTCPRKRIQLLPGIR